MKRPIAFILSAVFHPLLLPGYLYYMVCYQLPGVVLLLPLPERRRLLGVVLLFTLVLPTLGTVLLLRSGRVQGTLELQQRQQRPLPFLLATLSFGAGAVLLYKAPQPLDPLLRHMMGGMTLAVLLTLLISLRWKISAHGAGVGGAVGLLALLWLGNLHDMRLLGWWLGSLAVAGAVLHARLTLRAHTPAQAWAGLGMGVALVLGLGAALVLR